MTLAEELRAEGREQGLVTERITGATADQLGTWVKGVVVARSLEEALR